VCRGYCYLGSSSVQLQLKSCCTGQRLAACTAAAAVAAVSAAAAAAVMTSGGGCLVYAAAVVVAVAVCVAVVPSETAVLSFVHGGHLFNHTKYHNTDVTK
jgi:anti-sigma factor RsiW